MSDVLFYGRHAMVTQDAKCYIAPGDSHDDAFAELAQHIQFMHQRIALQEDDPVIQGEKEQAFVNRLFGIASECNCRADHGAEGADHLKAIAKMIREAIHVYEGSPE